MRLSIALPIAVLLSVSLTGLARAQAAKSDDERAIEQVIDQFDDLWNRRDAHAFTQLFSENADFVVITGQALSGRTEIETYHTRLLETIFAGSHLTWQIKKVRLVQSNAAVAHVSTEMQLNDGRKVNTFATLVLAKDGDTWRIEAIQNLLPSTLGPPARQPPG